MSETALMVGEIVERIQRRLREDSPTKPDVYIVGNLNRILRDELAQILLGEQAWNAMMNEKGYVREIARLHKKANP